MSYKYNKRNYWNYINYKLTGDTNRGYGNFPVWNPASPAYYHDKHYGYGDWRDYIFWSEGGDDKYLKNENHWIANAIFSAKKLFFKDTLGMRIDHANNSGKYSTETLKFSPDNFIQQANQGNTNWRGRSKRRILEVGGPKSSSSNKRRRILVNTNPVRITRSRTIYVLSKFKKRNKRRKKCLTVDHAGRRGLAATRGTKVKTLHVESND